MKKPVIYTYIALFLALCVLPVAAYPILSPYIDQENYENRLAKQAPELTLNNLEEFPQEYEAYFNDNIPFRSYLIEANSLINYYLFRQSPVRHVIIGKDGWLFYDPAGSDGNPIADACGENDLTAAELEKCAANLTEIRDTLQSMGKEFVIVIAPNKGSLYGKSFLPGKYKTAERTTADQVVSYLSENTDLTVVYPKAELQRAIEKNPEYSFYYKTDTHWNELGGYIAARELLGTLKISLPELQELTVRATNNAGDLAQMMAMSKYLSYDEYYSVSGYPGNTDYQIEYPVENNSQIIRCAASRNDSRSVFMIRDSFAYAMIPYISSQFNECFYVHADTYTPEYLAEVDPDIVVVEVVERYIRSLLSLEV